MVVLNDSLVLSAINRRQIRVNYILIDSNIPKRWRRGFESACT